MPKVEIDNERIPNLYRRLAQIMQEYVFDTRLLNEAVISNARTLEDEAQYIIRQKQEIIDEHAAKWSEDEDMPDNVEPGDLKYQMRSGQQIPQFPSEKERDEAQKKLDDLFDGSKVFTITEVPSEAVEYPEGETMQLWYDLDFMVDFEDGGKS
ncbi:hypothetical protein [Salinibacter phage M31CR41-2]|uniref:Uncharacterized protein n=1 Tax=Salinibacter phage M31CR41-2 TaxID=2681614 RepID=A0A2I6UHA8_9CAUD|nr:hypothetical protein FGG68_gp54 [Salinibacter phage M31CR41-2]AUO79297.1 hypothetical protein [Salinibacter phage M31CR41-2]